MAIMLDAAVSPGVLTRAIRNITPAANLTLLNTFPTTYSQDNTVRFGDMSPGASVAQYRAFDGAIPVADRGTARLSEVDMAPFSNSLNLGEYERLQIQFARLGGTNKAALTNAIYNDAERLVNSMHNRRELAMGQVLSTGKFSVNENGLITESDFGVPAGNMVTAATAWTNTSTAKVMDDLRAWVAAYRTNSGGQTPGGFITSQRVISLMLTNAQVVAEAIGTQTGRTRVSLAELQGLLASEGLPTVLTAYDTMVGGQRVMADDKFVIVPADRNDFLEFRFGLSATALELVNAAVVDFSFSDGPGIVGVVEKVGPPYRQFTYVDAVGMPILSNARALFVADVA